MKKAIIFDMDGVIVDSEHLWSKAENEIFSSLGVKLDEDSCQLTQSMTTREVAKFWYTKYPWKDIGLKQVEQRVISRVITLIEDENCEITGIRETIKKLKSNGFKIGLATNSPYQIPIVLDKLGIANYFDAIISSEFVKNGKPEPDIYIKALQELEELPEHCIVIEDSNTGIASAKKAGITTIGFTNSKKNKYLENADYIIHEYAELDLIL